MNFLKPFYSQNFLLGIGIAAVGSLFAPTIKEGVRSLAVKGAQGAMMVGDAAKNMKESGKEMMQKDENDNAKDLANELKSDREQYNSVLKELVTTMKDIQSEV